MKKINIIAIIILLITSSCRVEEYPDAIIGLWKLNQIDNNSQIGCQNQSTLRFTDTEIESTDYDANSNPCTIRDQQTFTYTITDSLITMNSTPPDVVEITYIDDTTLKLRKPEGTGFTTLTLLRQ